MSTGFFWGFCLLFLTPFHCSAVVASDPNNTMVDPLTKATHTTDSLSLEFSASFQNRHIWRGSLTCSAWNIQPTINLSKNNFLIGAWSAYTVDNSYAEVDLYISYSIGRLNIAVLDYFCPNETAAFNRLFDFNQRTTQHTVDVTLTYEISKKFPLSLMASTLVYGDDLNPKTGKNYFSTYVEASYIWTKKPKHQIETSIGFTPFEGYYASSLNVVNIGLSITKNLAITESFQLPVFGKLIVNPYSENIYFVFGLSIETH
jgi:hypothetical protein